VQNQDGMRALPVEAGENTIEFAFIPFWLYCGAGSTVISIVLILFITLKDISA
jgi:uncharacterized membrane protein YfhO